MLWAKKIQISCTGSCENWIFVLFCLRFLWIPQRPRTLNLKRPLFGHLKTCRSSVITIPALHRLELFWVLTRLTDVATHSLAGLKPNGDKSFLKVLIILHKSLLICGIPRPARNPSLFCKVDQINCTSSPTNSLH